MKQKAQKIVNWGLSFLVICFLIWEQTILLGIWEYLIDSPYWIINKVELGWGLASAWLLALLPWKWAWYIPLKVAYRWVIEDIILLMLKEKVVAHLILDLKIYTIMKLKSFNKWIAGLMVIIGGIPIIGGIAVWGIKTIIALIKKVFMNTVFSKIKLFLFKYIPLIFTYVTSIFPFIGGLFELLFQMFAIDVIIGWIERIPKVGPWLVKSFRWIREWIDNTAKKARDWLSSKIGARIEKWSKTRALGLRIRTMQLKSTLEDENFLTLQERLELEKKEKKKIKEEKRKTLSWKLQSYSGLALIFTYLGYFAYIAYVTFQH